MYLSFLPSGRKKDLKFRGLEKKRNFRYYFMSIDKEFSVFCLIFFDTLYRIFNVCREESEENERMSKVLLCCVGSIFTFQPA